MSESVHVAVEWESTPQLEALQRRLARKYGSKRAAEIWDKIAQGDPDLQPSLRRYTSAIR